MATVVFNNGAGGNLWSTPGNWVGDALPLAGDVADLNENCTLDMDDIIAQLDVLAGKTLTMNAGYGITGMTASCLGAGTISMGAGCNLKWNSASDLGNGTVNITARGAVGSWCTIDNVGAGRFMLNGTACSLDCEYIDFLSVMRLAPAGGSPFCRLINCNIRGGKPGTSTGDYVIPQTKRKILENLWISNFGNANGALWVAYSSGASWRARNVTFGRDRLGNVRANTVDLGLVGASSGAFGALTNAIFTAATPIKWGTDGTGNFPWDRVCIENYGFNPADGTPGTAGVWYFASLYGSIERSTTNPKPGQTYAARVTPAANCSNAEDRYVDLDLWVPIQSGDDAAIDVWGYNVSLSQVGAVVIVIDPEGSWYTPTTITPTWTPNTWIQATGSANGASGSGAKGSLHIALRVKEYAVGATFDWSKCSVTCGGKVYAFSWQQAGRLMLPDEPAATGGGVPVFGGHVVRRA